MENKIIKQLKEEAEACGHNNVRVRDIGYAVLNHVLRSPKACYAMMFPSENEDNYKEYSASPLQKTLAKRVSILLKPKAAEKPPEIKEAKVQRDDITADENRAEIMASIKRLEEMKDDPGLELTAKDRIAIEKQLLQSRTALKEKFEVSQSAEEQLIIVQPKFNHICDKTGKECWLQTKEFAMQHWGLIDPDNQ